jgi:hypothetical protein
MCLPSRIPYLNRSPRRFASHEAASEGALQGYLLSEQGHEIIRQNPPATGLSVCPRIVRSLAFIEKTNNTTHSISCLSPEVAAIIPERGVPPNELAAATPARLPEIERGLRQAEDSVLDRRRASSYEANDESAHF